MEGAVPDAVRGEMLASAGVRPTDVNGETERDALVGVHVPRITTLRR